MRKLIVLLFMLTLLSNGLVLSQSVFTKDQLDRISRIECKLVFVGDAIVAVRTDGKTNLNRICTLPPVIALFTSPFHLSYEADFITSATFTPTGGESIYNFQSNSTAAQLWQNPNNAGQIHAVYMTVPYGEPSPYPNRRSSYYYSADTGTTWAYINDVPNNTLKSGYCTITGMSDGNVLVANHSVVPPSAPYRTQVYADIFPGLGSWISLDPPLGGVQQAEWPRIVATSNITNPNKFVFISSCNPANFTTNDDSTFYNVGTSLTSPGTFAGWTFFSSDNGERYAIAKGTGKIGIAFLPNTRITPADNGDVFFMESTDDGNTFSTPLKIFDANITPSTSDSLGASSGISIIYQGSEPKVVFATVTLSTSTVGSYYPSAYANIRFWSPTLSGTDPNKSIVIADSNKTPWNPYIWSNSADFLAGYCKPAIGISTDDNVLFTAFMAASNQVGGSPDTLSYMDVYLTASGDIGNSWKTPVKLNPDVPRRDWGYQSISPYNDHSSTDWYANLVIQSDTVPGSIINHSVNGQSLAQLMFVRVKISKDSIVSVKNISNEIPGEYSLQQNYPNPFNPSTTIRFEIPSTSNVTLKVYNITGQEVASLVNNEVVSAGIKEIDFNAVNLSSGIYFYTLSAGDFKDTKKMILLK